MSPFEDNATLFMERFPKLTLLLPHTTSRTHVMEQVPPIDSSSLEALYVVGLGLGGPYFQFREWLQENPERKLIFLENDLEAFVPFLHEAKSKEVISDPQVHFEWLEKKKETLDAIAEKTPFQRIDVVAAPSKKGSFFQNLRLTVLKKTALAYAFRTDRMHGYQLLENFSRNLAHMPGSFYVNRMRGSFVDTPAIICGAGPSLQSAMPHLRTMESKALLIAGGSAIAALTSRGVLPHFGMAIDPNLEEYRRMKNSFGFEMPLLYSTRVFPSVFQTCNGPFGYMRSGTAGALEYWIEEELGLSEPIVGEALHPESNSVITLCVAFAEMLGCNPIFLAGVDLAYTNQRRYAAGVADNKTVCSQSLDANKAVSDRILKRKDRLGRTVLTAVRWVMESKGLSDFAKKHCKTRFFNTTEGGIGVKGIPFLSLEEADQIYLQRPSNLRRLVYEKIASCPMPPQSGETIDRLMGELRQSLDRVIGHLEVLSGEKPGSRPLAEVELQDELAMRVLFYDVVQLFGRSDPWSQFLTLARQY